MSECGGVLCVCVCVVCVWWCVCMVCVCGVCGVSCCDNLPFQYCVRTSVCYSESNYLLMNIINRS